MKRNSSDECISYLILGILLLTPGVNIIMLAILVAKHWRTIFGVPEIRPRSKSPQRDQ